MAAGIHHFQSLGESGNNAAHGEGSVVVRIEFLAVDEGAFVGYHNLVGIGRHFARALLENFIGQTAGSLLDRGILFHFLGYESGAVGFVLLGLGAVLLSFGLSLGFLLLLGHHLLLNGVHDLLIAGLDRDHIADAVGEESLLEGVHEGLAVDRNSRFFHLHEHSGEVLADAQAGEVAGFGGIHVDHVFDTLENFVFVVFGAHFLRNGCHLLVEHRTVEFAHGCAG